MNERTEYTLTTTEGDYKAVFSDLAEAANGSVMLTYGTTVIHASAVMRGSAAKDAPYFPLVVDYEERHYARGAILGGAFMKREGKPSDEAITTSRMIDRAIRPLFSTFLRNDIQIIITVLAVEQGRDPGPLALFAASLALCVSDIPWNGPISPAHIAVHAQGITFNPTTEAADKATLELLVAGSSDGVVMLEGEGREASEELVAQGIEAAQMRIAEMNTFQRTIAQEIGKPKRTVDEPVLSAEIVQAFNAQILPSIRAILTDATRKPSKPLEELLAAWITTSRTVDSSASRAALEEGFMAAARHIFEELLFLENRRFDGRKNDEIRSLSAELGGISPVLHGSGTFYRGGTHVSSFLTLGSEKDALVIDGMEVSRKKFFIHHYNFPPFSTGDTGRVGTPNRRAIGHGALAEKALRAILPPREKFPYTIRLVSEVFASNGSTSMASICAGSLALAHGHVPITKAAAGVAIGLVVKNTNEYKLLRDIQGIEDHLGDMDFKVAGTREGISAIQMDTKTQGIRPELLVAALTEAKEARHVILETLDTAIAANKSAPASTHLPKTQLISIPQAKIGALIGPGGSTVRAITDESGARIDVSPQGSVSLFGTETAINKAIELIGKHVK